MKKYVERSMIPAAILSAVSHNVMAEDSFNKKHDVENIFSKYVQSGELPETVVFLNGYSAGKGDNTRYLVKYLDDVNRKDVLSVVISKDGELDFETKHIKSRKSSIENTISDLLNAEYTGIPEHVHEVEIFVYLNTLEYPKGISARIEKDINSNINYMLNGTSVSKTKYANSVRNERANRKGALASQTRGLEVFQFLNKLGEGALADRLDGLVKDGGGYLTASITELTMDALSAFHNPLVSVFIDMKHESRANIDDAMRHSEIFDHARFGTHRGAGITIRQHEGFCGQNNWAPLGGPNYVSDDNGPPSTTVGDRRWHAESMASVMRYVSPAVTVNCRSTMNMPTLNEVINTGIDITTRSAAWTPTNGNYGTRDGNEDNRIFQTNVPHVQSAGNRWYGIENVWFGARSANSIGVGDINISATGANVAATSSWIDSSLGNMKPEISAPGQGTFLPVLDRTTGGTSAAAAHTAGFLANIMDNVGPLTAAQSKALMMAGATKDEGVEDREGVGSLDYRDTSQFMVQSNVAINTNVNIYIPWNKPNVRAVITWMNSGTYILNNGFMPVDYDLRVTFPNGHVIHSVRHSDPFDVIEFVAPQGGTYQFRITQFSQPGTNNDHGAPTLAVNYDD